MSVDVAMKLVSGIPPKGGERGGKDARTEAGGFDEMLAGKADKRMPRDARGKENADEAEAPAQWRLGGYDARVAMAMPRIDRTAATLEEASPLPAAEGEDASVEEAFAALVAQAPDAADEAAAKAGTDAPATTTGPAAGLAAAQSPRQRGEKDRPVGQADAAQPLDEAGDTDQDGTEPTVRTTAADGASQARPNAGTAAVQQATPATTTPARQQGGTEPAADRQQAQAGDVSAERQPRPAAASRQAPEGPATARAQPSMPAADGAQPRVNVLGFTTAVAPAATTQLSPTAAGLVATIEAEPSWRAAAAEAAALTGPRAQQPGTVSTLRIQLNPAELGMVTARLTATGSQLEIEIRVESNDARQRLAHDSDAIVKALRSVGYDVDKVTIQQAPQSGGTPAQQGGSGRDSFLQGQQQAGDNARGRNGQGSGDGDQAARHGAMEKAAERADSGVYI